MACWEGTAMNSVYLSKGSTNWVLQAAKANTPGNLSVTKFCGFGDIKADWGLAVYTTLRQARTSNRTLTIAVDDSQADAFLGWKITEVNLY